VGHAAAKEQTLRSTIVAGVVAGAFLLGSVGAALVIPSIVAAADPTAAPSVATTPTTGTTPSTGADPGGPGMMGGRHEAVTDASVVAKAIGITEADLNTALAGGKTVADVSKAHNVAVQTVVDALVADGKGELDAAVKAGTITQAQADAELANLTARATDQANGTGFGPGGPGPGHGTPGAGTTG
jgi:hypothetical protein